MHLKQSVPQSGGDSIADRFRRELASTDSLRVQDTTVHGREEELCLRGMLVRGRSESRASHALKVDVFQVLRPAEIC